MKTCKQAMKDLKLIRTSIMKMEGVTEVSQILQSRDTEYVTFKFNYCLISVDYGYEENNFCVYYPDLDRELVYAKTVPALLKKLVKELKGLK